MRCKFCNNERFFKISSRKITCEWCSRTDGIVNSSSLDGKVYEINSWTNAVCEQERIRLLNEILKKNTKYRV